MTAGKDGLLVPEIHGERVWTSMKGSLHLRLDFPKAGHFSFANLCDALPPEIIPDQVFNDGCSSEFTSSVEVHDVTKAYALAFILDRLFENESASEYLKEGKHLRDIATVE